MLTVFSSIENLYPDIGGELENRHSSLYGRLKTKFARLYCDYQPDYFISVKGVANILGVNTTPIGLQFALENGITLAVKQTEKQQSIYLNTEQKDQQEVELDYKGALLDNECELAHWASLGIRAALLNEKVQNLYGAVMYMSTTIPKDSFNCREAIILAICCGTIMVNRLQKKITFEKIQQNLYKVDPKGKYPSFFKFNNDEFRLTDGKLHKILKIPAQNNWKLLLTDILLPTDEQNRLKTRKKFLKMEQKIAQQMLCDALNLPTMQFNEILCYFNSNIEKLKELSQIHLPEVFEKKSNIHWNTPQVQFERFNPRRKFLHSLKEYQILFNFVSNQADFTITMNQSYKLMRQEGMVNSQIQNLVQFCFQSGVTACTLIDSRFLVTLCQRRNLLGVFNQVRSRIFCGENGEERFSEGVHHLIFSTLPSRGVGILNPMQEIWF